MLHSHELVILQLKFTFLRISFSQGLVLLGNVDTAFQQSFQSYFKQFHTAWMCSKCITGFSLSNLVMKSSEIAFMLMQNLISTSTSLESKAFLIARYLSLLTMLLSFLAIPPVAASWEHFLWQLYIVKQV